MASSARSSRASRQAVPTDTVKLRPRVKFGCFAEIVRANCPYGSAFRPSPDQSTVGYCAPVHADRHAADVAGAVRGEVDARRRRSPRAASGGRTAWLATLRGARLVEADALLLRPRREPLQATLGLGQGRIDADDAHAPRRHRRCRGRRWRASARRWRRRRTDASAIATLPPEPMILTITPRPARGHPLHQRIADVDIGEEFGVHRGPPRRRASDRRLRRAWPRRPN